MKSTFKYFIAMSLAYTFMGCGNSSSRKADAMAVNSFSEIGKANWLLGDWQGNSPEGIAMEAWEKKNDSVFVGKSYFVVGKDTVSAEALRLEQNGRDLFYIPTVRDQNNNQPVTFRLTFSTDKQLVFENPGHDFPQKISYTLVTSDSLVAEISGTMDGKENSQKFPMVRLK
jgi:Domain of unknown function (DUF6265)